MESWSVEEWLKKAGMGRYAEAFQDNGYETPELCANLKDEDLDAVGVVSKQHRSKIFALAETLQLEVATSSQANDSYNNNNVSSLSVSPPSFYSEPWTGGSKQNGVAMHATEATDSHSAVSRKTSGEKKGTMPPVKTKRQTKQKRAPTSSSLPPAPYQREEGAPILTKLQLKLKIRDELRKDGILLSEPPYCKDGEQLDESQLVDLAERYSKRFRVDSLGVYDALVNVWQHSMNKSGYVIPAAAREVEKKPSEGSSSTQDPTSNYDEPFDTQSGASPKPLARVASHEVPILGKPKLTYSPKSRTLPPNGFQNPNYDEPFDTVSTPTESSPKQPKPKSGKQLVKQEVQTPSVHLHNPPIKRSASSGSSPEEKRKLSADISSQRSPHTSPRTSPKLSPSTKSSVFKRFWKKQRSHSVREFDVAEETKSSRKKHTSKDEHKHKHKHGSAENLVEHGVPSLALPSHRTSVPVITFQEGRPGSPPPPVPPNRLLGSYDSTTSESDDSPHPPKKHQFGTKFRKKLQSPPTRHRKSTEEDFSSGESYSEQDRGMMPLPRMRKVLTTSDFELHKITEDADSRQQSLRLSQSHEELRNTGVTFADTPDKEEKQVKKPGLISRIFKWRTATPTLRKQSKWGRNRDSTVSESAVMTSSKSMPEIALAAVMRRSVNALDGDKPSSTDTGFAGVFDPVQSSGKDVRPPKPLRQRTLQRSRSPIASPDESPPMQHKMVITSVTSTSPTDLIPIHGSSAPGVPSYLENGSPAHLIPGTQSPEHDEIKFSDSEDQKGDKTVGTKKPSHSMWSPRSRSPQDTLEDSESPAPKTDSHSHSPTHLQRDNEQGPSPTSETNLTRSSSGSSTSSTSARKPPPPPKPKQLSVRGRPTPPPTVTRKPLESQLEEKEREAEAPTVVPAGKQPPPKPTRSKYRTLRIESGKKTQEAVEAKSKTLSSRTQSGGSLDENDPAVPPRKPPHLYMFDRCGSDGSIAATERSSERMGSTGSLPGTPEGLRKPKPLPKPKLLMKVPPMSSRTEEPAASQALETLLCDKLSEEGIDLTQMPYSSMWGESAIPSLLISRYASELSQSEERIAPALDEIRGKKLQEQSRDYVAAKQSSWQNHTEINTDDIDGFLTSVGLPMYSQVFKQKGYVAIQQVSELGGAGLDVFGLKAGHSEIIMRHLPAL